MVMLASYTYYIAESCQKRNSNSANMPIYPIDKNNLCKYDYAMVKNTDKHLHDIFAKAFHEVVVPLLENMATKDDVKDIKENMATKDDVDRIELKLVKIEDKLDRHDAKLDNHEKRISKFERKSAIL